MCSSTFYAKCGRDNHVALSEQLRWNERPAHGHISKISDTGWAYRNQGQQKTMGLSADEFIRRFLLHALPDKFPRIRYYCFLGNCYG